MGADTNAHSQMYGPTTNKRGEGIEELILHHGLYVANKGQVPTFEVRRNDQHIRTCINVTLTRGNVDLLDWRVDRTYNASDHNDITWKIED